MIVNVLSVGSLVLALAGPCVAQVNVSGTWRGQCTRPNHDPSNGSLVISGGKSATFFGGPVHELEIDYPAIQFVTTAGASGTPREFVGAFKSNGDLVTGKLTQDDQKYADCRFQYVE